MDERAYWLGFSRVPGIGRVNLDKLRAHFTTLAEAWRAPVRQLYEAGLGQALAERVAQERPKLDLEAALTQLHRLGAHYLVLTDPDYPPLLRPLRAAPPVLYVRGTLREADAKALAVVGTRKATRYGRDITTEFCGALAKAGVTIVSGLAIGIDAAAHTAALDAGGRTVAVLGGGVDVVYPRENAALHQRIVESGQGALVSQFPPAAKPDGANFPRRNAVLSGLCLGTLLVEAPLKSGALHTVNAALEQGRDVFAIPHSLHNVAGTANNRLIQEGAQLVSEPRDILDALDLSAEQVQTRAVAERLAPDSPDEAQVLALLTDAPIHVDDLARALAMPIPQLTATLTLLELKGLAQPLGHMQYCAT
jgi:DNA processing protein